MKRNILLFCAIIVFALGLVACSSEKESDKMTNADKFLTDTQKVQVTFYSGPDIHEWELTQEEIEDWIEWLNNLVLEQKNFDVGSTPDDYYEGGSRYVFDVNTEKARIEYVDYGIDETYLVVNAVWYKVNNPKEPYNKY